MQAKLKEEIFQNEGLFSEHYLKDRLPNRKIWKKEEEKIKEIFNKIKEIYKDNKTQIEACTNNEAELERIFIRPVLKELGHIFRTQEVHDGTGKKPDYAFFSTKKSKENAIEKRSIYKTAMAIGDAKSWKRDLDKDLGGKTVFENKNPSYQIDYYLRTTKPKWGILTNGKKWRVYFENSEEPISTYYEVDLIEILAKNNFESFKYFYFFFRREAFLPREGSFLDKVYEKGVKYAEKIGENLEKNVYKALLWMAKGYFNMNTNNLKKNKENIKKVHDNSLIFLYRLLFLLYAESKGILKNIPKKYADEYSFTKWIEGILKDIDENKVNPQGGIYNYKLFKIFKLINKGSKALGIPKEDFYTPAYNGNLFDNEEYPFLKNKKIQDGYIAKVVDLLVRPSEHKGKGRIDYSDLSVRHLGGIYEGLLEYKLKAAEEDLAGVKKRGKETWIPTDKAENKRIYDEVEKGELYLETDKGERKATGSYYTPDYIVKYIVKNTLGPVIEKKLEKTNTPEEKKEAILSTKILDPAMGSGHFLVEATSFLAERLIRADIRSESDGKRDIDWAKREVVKRCIYGVDLNPLATELTKVSLWLNTLSEDKPLSFLDHHLKTGNSLIGADIHKLDKHPEEKSEEKDEEKIPKQLELDQYLGENIEKSIKLLLKMYKDLMRVSGENIEDIHKQEEIYHKYKDHKFRNRFEQLANVYISYYFGNEFSKEQYNQLLEAFPPGEPKWDKVTGGKEWFQKAQEIAEKKNFFHWKLEFLEAFFEIGSGKEKKENGFDAIIGNPPYGIDISKEKKIIEKKKLSNHSSVLFMQRFLEKCKSLGFIIPKPITYTFSWKEDREYLLNYNFRNLVDVNEAFEDVKQEQMILILSDESIDHNPIIGRSKKHKDKIKELHELKKDFLNKDTYLLWAGGISQDIYEKLWDQSTKLEKGIGHSFQPPGYNRYLESKEFKNSYVAYKGNDIQRFYIRNKHYINKEKLENRDISKYKKDKVLVQRIVAHITKPAPQIVITAAVDKEGGFAVNTLNCVISDKFPANYLCGLLNSQLFSWYGYNFIYNRAIRSMDLYPGYMNLFSFKKDPNQEKVNKIAEDSRKISKKKQKIMEERDLFLKWLGRRWDVNIENLSLKTYLKEYWEYEFKEMLRIANRNKSKIEGDPSSRKFQERLEKEWEKSIDKIKPLLKEIQNLKNKLNASVFNLYNLNKKEIIEILESQGLTDKNKKAVLNNL